MGAVGGGWVGHNAGNGPGGNGKNLGTGVMGRADSGIPITSSGMNPIENIQSGNGVFNGGGNLGNLWGKGGGGGISGITGTAGGVAGTGLPAPEMPNIQSATGVGQVMQSQVGADQSLQSQNNLLAALQGQGGLSQQNSVAAQQQNLANQLGRANAIDTQMGAIQRLQGIAGQQANTAGMYQNIANGQGPNPAQAMLNQQTGQNVANQAAMMAGQRGAGSNIGLMARQAGQQGAATQQQAVGQGATMQANQQLNALSGLNANQQAQVGTQQAIGGLGSTQLGAQQAQQQALANQANTVAGQQIAGTQANTQANLANMTQNQNALQGINASNVTAQGNVNAANASLANTQMQGQQAIQGGLMQGAGTVLGSVFGLGKAHGGEITKMADGGGVPAPAPNEPYQIAATPAPAPGPQSSFGKFLTSSKPMSGGEASRFSGNAGAGKLQSGSSALIAALLGGGAKALMGGAAGTGVDPNAGMTGTEDLGGGSGIYSEGNAAGGIDEATQQIGGEASSTGVEDAGATGAETAATAAKGGLAVKGGHVKAKKPSQKPVKRGDSYDNDKVPAMLSAGEVVIPRSVMHSKDPVRGAADFVAKTLAKRGRK